MNWQRIWPCDQIPGAASKLTCLGCYANQTALQLYIKFDRNEVDDGETYLT
jgi:hypothetical protein